MTLPPMAADLLLLRPVVGADLLESKDLDLKKIAIVQARVPVQLAGNGRRGACGPP